MIRYELERVWELEGTEWIIRNAEANSHFKKIIRTKDIENTEQFNKYFRELQERYLCEKQAKLLGIGETRFYDAVQSTIKNKYLAFHKGITCPKYDPEGESASFSERYVIREAAGVLAKLALFNFNGLYYPMRVVDGEDLSCGDKKHLNNVIDLVLSEYEEQTKKPFNIFRAAIMHKNKVSHSERKVDKKQVSINGGVPVDVEFEQKTAGIGPLARLGSSKQLSGMIQRPTTPDTMILNRPTTPDTMMMSINKAMSELTFLQQQFVSMQMGIFQNKMVNSRHWKIRHQL
jgi:hypothetical protein